MHKFKKLFLLTLLLLPLLTSCGNKDVLGLTYTFNHATIKLPDGTIVSGNAFNKIVFKNNQYVTTIKQVKEFIDKCLTHYHQQTKNYFDNDEIFTLVYESNIPDDTVVTIEFEES